MIFHLSSSNLHSYYQYLLPEHYVDVSEADIENINNRKLRFSLF